MPSREELLAQAKQKLERETLLIAAKQKLAQEAAPVEVPLAQKIETGARGMLAGGTFGTSEPVISGINALIGKGIEDYFRRKEEAAGIPVGPEKTISELYQEDVERRKALEQAAPGAELAGQLIGAVSPIGAGALAMKGIRGAVEGAKAIKALGKAAPIATETLTGAGLGGAQAIGQTVAGEEVEPILEQVKTGAIAGAALPVAGKAISALGGAAKTGIQTFLGVRPEVMTRFLADPKAVMAAKSRSEITELAQEAVEKIKQTEGVLKLDLTDDVATGLSTLKKQIMDASENAYKTLEVSDKKVPLVAVKNAIKASIADLEKPGFVGPSVQEAKTKVTNFVNSLEGLPDDIDGVTLKRIVKSLDDDLEFLGRGEFAGSRSQASLLQARGNVDQILKTTYPAYAEAIKPVRDLAQFHDEVFKKLSTPEKVYSSLTKLGKPGREIEDQRLRKFFQQTNIDPERMRQAQADADMFRRWDSMATAEQKVKGMMTERSDALKEQFRRLSQLSETDFLKEIENLSTRSAFEQEFLRGSRNVNLWTIMGGGAGTAIGGGLPGAIAGAAIGGLIDKKGPQVAMQVLKAYSEIRGLPTIQKIQQKFSDLPKDTQQEIQDAFVRLVVESASDVEPTYVAPKDREDVAYEIRSAKHLSMSEKAKMLQSLGRYGEVPNFQKLVIGSRRTLPEQIQREPSKQATPNLKSISQYVKSKKEAI